MVNKAIIFTEICLMQIQAAGGNTSIKVGDTLWVKASGKWLSKADEEGFMVQMSISRINRAIELSSCTDEDIIECVTHLYLTILLH